MVERQFSLKQARKVVIGAQGFYKTYTGSTLDKLRTMMGYIHVLQLDAISVITRTQYMPGYSRFGPYDREQLDKIAYEKDEWFETWAHEACLAPVEYEPLFRWIKERTKQGATWQSLSKLAEEQPGFIQDVFKQVVKHGPMKPSKLKDQRKKKSANGWGHLMVRRSPYDV